MQSHRPHLAAIIGLSLAACAAVSVGLREVGVYVVSAAHAFGGWLIGRLVSVCATFGRPRAEFPSFAKVLHLPGSKAMANWLVRRVMPVVTTTWRMCPSV